MGGAWDVKKTVETNFACVARRGRGRGGGLWSMVHWMAEGESAYKKKAGGTRTRHLFDTNFANGQTGGRRDDRHERDWTCSKVRFWVSVCVPGPWTGRGGKKRKEKQQR